jgi:hypothetical protein
LRRRWKTLPGSSLGRGLAQGSMWSDPSSCPSDDKWKKQRRQGKARSESTWVNVLCWWRSIECCRGRRKQRRQGRHGVHAAAGGENPRNWSMHGVRTTHALHGACCHWAQVTSSLTWASY